MSFVHHIGFNCVDRQAQEEFYTKHFGFNRARVINKGQPNEFVMLRLGDTCIELFSADADAGHLEPQPVGFKHMAFEVPDIDAKVNELHEAGIETGDVIDCSDDVSGLRVCFFKDPDGNAVEILEGWSDEQQSVEGQVLGNQSQ